MAADQVEVKALHVDNNLVTLNIGGQRFSTTASTLARYEATRLATLNHDDPAYDPNKDEYVFDHSPQLFPHILDIYRNGKANLHSVDEAAFRQELDYWGLSERLTIYRPGCETKISTLKPGGMTKLWEILDDARSSHLALAWGLLYTALLLLSIICACVASLPNQQENAKTLGHVNFACTVVFVVELMLHFVACPRKRYFFWAAFNIFDILHSIPMFIACCLVTSGNANLNMILAFSAVSIMFRAFRVLKMGVLVPRFDIMLSTLRASVCDLFLLFIIICAQIVGFSCALYYADASSRYSQLRSVPDAFWWAIVSLTTVGYGDVVPVSPIGKMFGSFCLVTGLVDIGLVVTILMNNFGRLSKDLCVKTVSTNGA